MLKALGGLSIALMALSGCAVQPDTSPISLEERFYQNAFYNEEVGEEFPLERWDRPFVAYVNGATPEERQQIERTLNQMAEISGQSAALVWDPSADIRIFFVDDFRWALIMDEQQQLKEEAGYGTGPVNAICIIIPAVTHQGTEILLIAIPKSLDPIVRRQCIAQEVGHVSGLYYDAMGRIDTAFGDWAGADHLTEIDLTLLRILYDPRLKPGMTWAEARPIVRQIISELETSQGS